MSLVLDASAAVGWFSPSQATAAGDRLLGALESGAAIAPAIFAFELRNGLLKLERRGAITSPRVEAGLARLELLVRVLDHPPIREPCSPSPGRRL